MVFNYKGNIWAKCVVLFVIVEQISGIPALVSGNNSFGWILFFFSERHGPLHLVMSAFVPPDHCVISATALGMLFNQALCSSSCRKHTRDDAKPASPVVGATGGIALWMPGTIANRASAFPRNPPQSPRPVSPPPRLRGGWFRSLIHVQTKHTPARTREHMVALLISE